MEPAACKTELQETKTLAAAAAAEGMRKVQETAEAEKGFPLALPGCPLAHPHTVHSPAAAAADGTCAPALALVQ